MQHFWADNNRISSNTNDTNLQLILLGDNFQEGFWETTMNTATVVNDLVSLFIT
jgi:hypothetical protein